MDRFGKVCSLQSFKPFKSAKDALEQINAISEGVWEEFKEEEERGGEDEREMDDDEEKS